MKQNRAPTAASRPKATQVNLSTSSAILDAIRILKAHDFRRRLPLLGAMLLAGFLEAISVASLFPVLAIVTDSTQEPSKIQRAIERGVAFFHIPLNLEFLCILIATAICLKAIINLIVARQLGGAGAAIAQELRERLLNALMRAKWSYFTVQPVGRFIAAATSEANWASVAFRAALRAVEQLARTVIFCALAMLMGWQMAVISIGMGILMGFSLRGLARAARAAGRARRRAMTQLIREINDTLAGFKPLKAMNRHMHLLAELTKDAARMRSAINSLTLNQGLLIGLPDLIQVLLFATAAYLAAEAIKAPIDSIVVGGVIAFALTSNIVRVQQAMTTLAQADHTYWHLQETIAEVEGVAETLEGAQTPTLQVGCELRNVSFSYGRGPVLSDISMTIQAGRITAMIGQSGIGKTTIADLVLGLYVPTAGEVMIDNVDLRLVDIEQWRSMVGYVSQEIVLFNDTIFSNIALGDETIGEKEVMQAIEAAGLGGFVADLPMGLSATIGERGFRLSGGQRQRLALARALVRNPKLLILDEATSALDPATEEEICAAIAARSGEVTVFVITHQLSWIDRADVIYIVENGSLRQTTREEIRREK